MKIYVPMKITTEEAAEALPVGTPAYIDVIGGPARYSAVKTPRGDWYIGGREYHENREMTRWTALVEHEVHGRTVRSQGEIVPGIGGGTMLRTDFGKHQPLHERTVWTTEWQKAEDQG